MDHVRRHTSIPILALIQISLDDASEDGKGWILMQRLPGLQLDVAWPRMTDAARAATLQQLRSYLEQLRRLGPSTHGKGWIGSASGGPAYNHRLSNLSPVGPFASVAEFHDFLVAPVRLCPWPEWVAKYRRQLPDECGVAFSHADLSGENIMVDNSTGDVTGIIDWEMAGFWPEWWEYSKALFGSRTSKLWWVETVRSVMTEYPSETETDMELEMF